MKSILLALAVIASASSLIAADKAAAGPNGGRWLETEPLKSEFFVTPDRKVRITFFDKAKQPTAPGNQTISVIAEPKSGRKALELEATRDGFVSKEPLPAGDPYLVVVQSRASAEAKPKNFRIELNLTTCGECQLGEYACICGH
jgi:hypothetical protein